MDGSPLVLVLRFAALAYSSINPDSQAQTHARKAAKANTPTAAIDEHDLAAGQFATAAKSTENSEAFRTLKLLEQHHERLAQILKFENAHPVPQATEVVPDAKSPSSQTLLPVPTKSQDASPYRSQSQSLPAAHRPQRDVGSSIASNLASARGIPSNRQRRSGQAPSPVLAQQHAEGKIVSPPKRSRLADTPTKSTTAPPSLSEKPSSPSQQKQQPPISNDTTPIPPTEKQPPHPPKSDEPFNRFYSTFESLFSKLSAPLAFAGLPLTPDEPLPPPPPETKPTPKPPTRQAPSKDRATADPDYSQLFSRAALRAVRDDPATTLPTTESFYVVPTTGGTLPYASILARSSSSGHNPSLTRDPTSTSDDLDEFVDARETPGPPSSPQAVRGGSKRGAAGTKTMEELAIENESQRALIDELARRLYRFESGAQMSSVALHQSIRASMKQSASAHAVEVGGAHAEGGGAEVGKGEVKGEEGKVGEGKLALLEEQVIAGRKELERVGRENEKLKGVVGRYRERWEKLKEGARVRREGVGVGGGSGGGGGKGVDEE